MEIIKTLQRRAATAARLLWKMATDEEAPRAERIKLLQWYVELGIGKPGMIDKGARDGGGASSVGSVVLLPAIGDFAPEDADFTVLGMSPEQKTGPAAGPSAAHGGRTESEKEWEEEDEDEDGTVDR